MSNEDGCDEGLDVKEVASAARDDRRLEASEEPMVRVTGGKVAGDPGWSSTVTVIVDTPPGMVELPLLADAGGLVALEVVFPLSLRPP